MTMRRATWLLVLVVIGTLLVIPLPYAGREINALSDLAHAPVFGLVALAAFHGFKRLLPPGPVLRVLITWAVVVLVGGVTELVQILTNRSPSWHDALANALGSAAFLIWISTPSTAPKHVRFVLIMTGALLIVVASASPALILFDSIVQVRNKPLLASFENDLELSRWEFGRTVATRSLKQATEGTWSLRLVLDQGKYAGVTYAWPVHDWSAYRDFEFDAFLEPGPPLELVVKIEDQEHNGRYEDRFHRVERLEPGGHHVRIPLSEIRRAPNGRELDLSRIRRLEFFTASQPRPFILFLDNLHLR